MAVVKGNVIGNLSGKLGNLSARTVKGRTVLAARPSSFAVSQDPDSIAVRQKFAVTANFAKKLHRYQFLKVFGMLLNHKRLLYSMLYLRIIFNTQVWIDQLFRTYLHRADFYCP